MKELHGLSSQELSKLIRDSENNILHCTTDNGSSVQVGTSEIELWSFNSNIILLLSPLYPALPVHCLNHLLSMFQIDAEKLARCLPLHLIAMLISSERDEAFLRHLLRGFRLLHSLCDLASRQPRLEQVSSSVNIIYIFKVVRAPYLIESISVLCTQAKYLLLKRIVYLHPIGNSNMPLTYASCAFDTCSKSIHCIWNMLVSFWNAYSRSLALHAFEITIYKKFWQN